MINADILTKLQRLRGYQGKRIRPYPFNQKVWIAETYTYLGHGNAKGWTVLRDVKGRDYRTFPTPEQAYTALEALQKELDDLEKLFDDSPLS